MKCLKRLNLVCLESVTDVLQAIWFIHWQLHIIPSLPDFTLSRLRCMITLLKKHTANKLVGHVISVSKNSHPGSSRHDRYGLPQLLHKCYIVPFSPQHETWMRYHSPKPLTAAVLATQPTQKGPPLPPDGGMLMSWPTADRSQFPFGRFQSPRTIKREQITLY